MDLHATVNSNLTVPDHFVLRSLIKNNEIHRAQSMTGPESDDDAGYHSQSSDAYDAVKGLTPGKPSQSSSHAHYSFRFDTAQVRSTLS